MFCFFLLVISVLDVSLFLVRLTVNQPIDHSDDVSARLNETETPDAEIETIVDAIVNTIILCPVVCMFFHMRNVA